MREITGDPELEADDVDTKGLLDMGVDPMIIDEVLKLSDIYNDINLGNLSDKDEINRRVNAIIEQIELNKQLIENREDIVEEYEEEIE